MATRNAKPKAPIAVAPEALTNEQEARARSVENMARVCLDNFKTREEFREMCATVARMVSTFAAGGTGIGYAFRFSDESLEEIEQCTRVLLDTIYDATIVKRPSAREDHARAIAAARNPSLQAFIGKVSRSG